MRSPDGRAPRPTMTPTLAVERLEGKQLLSWLGPFSGSGRDLDRPAVEIPTGVAAPIGERTVAPGGGATVASFESRPAEHRGGADAFTHEPGSAAGVVPPADFFG